MSLSQYIKYSFTTHKGAAELLIALAWASPILGYVKAIVLRLPFGEVFGEILVPIIFFVLLCMSFSYLSKFFRGSDFLFVLLLFTGYLLQYILFPANEEVLDEYFLPLFLTVIPMFFIGVAIDIKDIFKLFYILSIVCVLLQAINTLFFETTERLSDFEDRAQMYEAYKLLPHVVFCFWGWLKKFNVFSLLVSLLGLFLLFSFGSRGPVACVLLFVALYVLLFKLFKGKIIVVLLLGILAAVIVLYSDVIMLALQNLLSQLGLNIRIIRLLTEGESAIIDSSGRDELSEILIRQLDITPIFGHGIGGTWKFIGAYSHSIILDFLISFGLIPGMLLLLSILYIIIKGYRACKTVEEKGFLLVLICCFAKLFISYTFLSDPSWTLLLGYCVGVIRRNRNQGVILAKLNSL